MVWITQCSKFSSLKLFRNHAKVYAFPKSLEDKIIISQHLCLFVTKGIIYFHSNHHKISLDGLIKDSMEDNNVVFGQRALFGIAHNLSNLLYMCEFAVHLIVKSGAKRWSKCFLRRAFFFTEGLFILLRSLRSTWRRRRNTFPKKNDLLWWICCKWSSTSIRSWRKIHW